MKLDDLDRAELMFKAGMEYASCDSDKMLRIARHDNGEVYVGAVEPRTDYGDETIAWIQTDLDYVCTGQLVYEALKKL